MLDSYTNAGCVSSKVSRNQRINAEQKSTLVDFMSDHLDFAQGKLLGVEGRKKHGELWDQLSALLNAEGEEPKSVTKWQKVCVHIGN